MVIGYRLLVIEAGYRSLVIGFANSSLSRQQLQQLNLIHKLALRLREVGGSLQVVVFRFVE